MYLGIIRAVPHTIVNGTYLGIIHAVPHAVGVPDVTVVVAGMGGVAKVDQHTVQPIPLGGTLWEGER